MSYFETLFNNNEGICIANDVYNTKIVTYQSGTQPLGNFVSINPMHTKRADANVTAFRNILLEFDSGTEAEQKAIVDTIPYSTLVHSGGKSLHAIISLAEPVADAEEYRRLVVAIYNKVPQADPAAKNASRFTRVPGIFRLDKGKFQTLLAVNGRVPNELVYTWLGGKPEPEQLEFEPIGREKLPNRWTRYFLEFGADTPEGMWNLHLFRAACDLARCGLSKEEVQARLTQVTGYLDRKDVKTIDSAYRTVRRDS